MSVKNKYFSAPEMQILNHLLTVISPSSHEDEIVNVISDYLKDYRGVIHQSVLKNLYFSFAPLSKTKPIVLFDAHCDEVGFGVKSITPNGYIKVLNYGGIDFRTLLGGRYVLINQKQQIFNGAIANVPPHLQRKLKISVKSIDELLFDFGFNSKQDAINHHINIDDKICFAAPVKFLVNDKVLAKAADNRISCFLYLMLIKHLASKWKNLPFQPLFVFSAQEEVGARGALTIGGLKTQVDFAVVSDVSPVVDQFSSNDAQIGKGVLLRGMDRGYITNPHILNFHRNLLKQHKLDHQFYIGAGGTNASVVHLLKSGIPVLQATLPARNIHSSASIFALRDLDIQLQFLKLLCEKINLQQINDFCTVN